MKNHKVESWREMEEETGAHLSTQNSFYDWFSFSFDIIHDSSGMIVGVFLLLFGPIIKSIIGMLYKPLLQNINPKVVSVSLSIILNHKHQIFLEQRLVNTK